MQELARLAPGDEEIRCGQVRRLRGARSRLRGRLDLLIAGAGALGFLAAGWRWYRSLGNYPLLFDHPSGTWAALAADFAEGELYRPLLSAAGYGGTRYFPLNIALWSALIRGGLSPAAGGHLLTLIGAVALAGGVFLLTRRSGASALRALGAAGLALGTVPAQWGVSITRGDLLPAGFAVIGLATCLPDRRGTRRLPLAALTLGLAILAKPTSLAAAAGAVFALAMSADRRAAVRLALGIAAVATLGAAGAWLASAGRWWESFAACATGGRARLLYAPVNLLRFAAPVDLSLVGLALSVLWAAPRGRRPFVALPLSLSAAATFALFGSPGIDENHLLEACALSVSALVSAEPRTAGPRAESFVIVFLAFLGLLNVGYPALRTGASAAEDRFAIHSGTDLHRQVSREVGPGERGPLLSENPWIPLLLGERPFVLDAFSLRILVQNMPRAREDLLRRIRSRSFRAVVLSYPLEGKERWYEEIHFGPGFVQTLRESYSLAAAHVPGRSTSGVYVWLPLPLSPRLPKGD
jgi:hypothetical protein